MDWTRKTKPVTPVRLLAAAGAVLAGAELVTCARTCTKPPCKKVAATIAAKNRRRLNLQACWVIKYFGIQAAITGDGTV